MAPVLQAEAADLAGRDVDVVGAGQVVVVRAAQEAEAVGQDLQRALAVHQAVLLDPLLEDLEDQVLLLQPRVLGDSLALGGADQLRHRHLLQLGEVDLAALDVLVAVVDLGIAEEVFILVRVGRKLDGLVVRDRRVRPVGTIGVSGLAIIPRGVGASRSRSALGRSLVVRARRSARSRASRSRSDATLASRSRGEAAPSVAVAITISRRRFPIAKAILAAVWRTLAAISKVAGGGRGGRRVRTRIGRRMHSIVRGGRRIRIGQGGLAGA